MRNLSLGISMIPSPPSVKNLQKVSGSWHPPGKRHPIPMIAIWLTNLADTFQSFPGARRGAPDRVVSGRVRLWARLGRVRCVGGTQASLPRLFFPPHLRSFPLFVSLVAGLQPSSALLKRGRLARALANVFHFDTCIP